MDFYLEKENVIDIFLKIKKRQCSAQNKWDQNKGPG